jgi:hypothetical protein
MTTTAEEYREPEEVQEKPGEGTPEQVFDPLSEDKKQRMHTTSGVGNGSDQPMPEYKINPTMDPGQTPGAESIPAGQAETEEEIPPYNDMKKAEEKMTPQQRQENAEMTAEMALEAYGGAWKFVGGLSTKIRKKEIRKLSEQGVNMDQPVDYNGQRLALSGSIEVYNEICEKKCEQFDLDEKTKEKIRPIIAAELAKRGWVLSPMMYVALVLAVDARKKITIIQQAREQKQEMIDAILTSSKMYANAGRPSMDQMHTATSPVPEQAAPPAPETPASFAVQESAAVVSMHAGSPNERATNVFNAINAEKRRGYERRGKKTVVKPGSRKRRTPKRNKGA